MAEIIMPILADRFKKSSPAKRREILDGLAERLLPLNRGAIGLMIDNNDLDAAIIVVQRANDRAEREYVLKAREYRTAHNSPYPITFTAPFPHHPTAPDKEAAKIGSMLREAIGSHL